MTNKSLLILGGYGITGKLIARLLLQETDLKLILGGRSLEKACSLAETLNTEFNTDRVDGIAVDAADRQSLRRAFQEAQMVIVASSTSQYARLVSESALEADIDYLDVQYSTQKLASLKTMAKDIEVAGRCFITECGFHPGVPAALVRYAAQHCDRLHKAVIGSIIKIDWKTLPLTEATIHEMMEEFSTAEMLIYQGGEWKSAGWWGMNALKFMDFSPYFKRQYCVPMFLEEMRLLTEIFPELRETSFYVGGFNWFVDWIIFPLAILGMKIGKKHAARPMGKFLMLGLRTFTQPPYGTVLKLEAIGLKDEREVALQLQLYHRDGYMMTAIPTVACLLQYLDGTIRKPGLWYQAHIVEPERFLNDMSRLGVEVTKNFP